MLQSRSVISAMAVGVAQNLWSTDDVVAMLEERKAAHLVAA